MDFIGASVLNDMLYENAKNGTGRQTWVVFHSYAREQAKYELTPQEYRKYCDTVYRLEYKKPRDYNEIGELTFIVSSSAIP